MSNPSAATATARKIRRRIGFDAANWPLFASGAMLALLWGRFFSTLLLDWKVDPQYAHGWFIPILALVLVGSRWSSLPTGIPGCSGGLVIALLVVALMLLVP